MLTPADFAARKQRLLDVPNEPRSLLRAYQDRLLCRVVQEAAEHVPCYRELFARHGLDIANFSGVRDLARLPITTRAAYQAEPDERLFSARWSRERFATSRSSGSSGRPITIRHTPEERVLYLALRSRTFRLLGEDWGGRTTYVGLDVRSPEERTRPLADGLTVVECRRGIAEIARDVIESRPTALIGYPGVLLELADFLSAEERRGLGLRVVVASGEVLTDASRQHLGERFGAPVSSTYASTEFFWMGGWCSATGQYHVVDDSIVLEIVDDAGRPVGPGETGRVVGTALHSLAQPIVRYEIGDRARRGDATLTSDNGCACGSPFSTIGEIEGRVLDYLTLPGGRRVHAYTLTIPMRDRAAFVERFQVIQEELDLVRVRLLCRRAPEATELSELARFLEGLLGDEARVVCEITTQLERAENGKFQFVVSRVGKSAVQPAAHP